MKAENIIVFCVLFLTLVPVCIAQEPQPEATAPAEKTASEDSASPDGSPAAASALPDHMLRDPFWPIGWQPKEWGQNPQAAEKIQGLKKWELAAKQISIRGISKDPNGRYFALIKDMGVVEEGDVISVDYGGLTYRWRIKEVTHNGIVPVKLDVAPTK